MPLIPDDESIRNYRNPVYMLIQSKKTMPDEILLGLLPSELPYPMRSGKKVSIKKMVKIDDLCGYAVESQDLSKAIEKCREKSDRDIFVYEMEEFYSERAKLIKRVSGGI